MDAPSDTLLLARWQINPDVFKCPPILHIVLTESSFPELQMMLLLYLSALRDDWPKVQRRGDVAMLTFNLAIGRSTFVSQDEAKAWLDKQKSSMTQVSAPTLVR